MRTREKQRVATDTRGSLVCRTTQLERRRKRKPIGEPKYKHGQQEQVTVRNHKRSTALERSALTLGVGA